MRYSFATILSVALASQAFAQGPPVKILRIQTGFRSQGPIADAPGRFKVGLWTPISIDLLAGPKGMPNCDLIVETPDSENVATNFTIPIGQLEKNEQRTIVTYAKSGNSEGRFNFAIRAPNGGTLATFTSSQFPPQFPLDLRGRIYLTLGSRLDLQKVFTDPDMRKHRPELGGVDDKDDTFPRFAAFETDPDRLPGLALGYDDVDLMILTTSGDSKFLQRLRRDNEGAKLKAIAGWVRQGGRLIVSVSWKNQPEVHELLKAQAWQPPLPVVPLADTPDVEKNAIDRLKLGALDKKMPVALLANVQRPEWEISEETQDGRPLVATMPYGRGAVTLIAFELDKEPFTGWDNRVAFLKNLIKKLEPTVSPEQNIDGRGVDSNSDLATQLQRDLDQFDVPVIPFGWVALFIIVYIAIVGPLDYFLLKKVFKSLEWTWITFPTVVILVSAVAYFTAYAVKGRDMKINQVDLVDFDLRTELDAKQRPRGAYAYGNTWFTIMSPQIKSYTIGVEPMVAGWWRGKAKEPHSAEVVSWLGRPEFDGPGAMGRPRSQGWSRRSYDYAADATSLSGVSIPVWTTKSFAASWEMPLPRLPVRADLVYHPDALDLEKKVTGTIQSFLPADLHDVWLFYEDRCYRLEGPLRGNKTGGEPREIKGQAEDIMGWSGKSSAIPQTQAKFHPTVIIKEIAFHKKVDTGQQRRNQVLQRLDLSWRILQKPKTHQTGVRDAILFGRLTPLHGAPENLAANNPLPTLLWLDDVPGSGNPRPGLSGIMNQETYIRIILPVKPAQ